MIITFTLGFIAAGVTGALVWAFVTLYKLKKKFKGKFQKLPFFIRPMEADLLGRSQRQLAHYPHYVYGACTPDGQAFS